MEKMNENPKISTVLQIIQMTDAVQRKNDAYNNSNQKTSFIFRD